MVLQSIVCIIYRTFENNQEIMIMKNIVFVFLAIIGLCLASCGGDDSKKPNKPKPTPKKEVGISGAKLYKTHCIVCHGADGKLGIGGAKDLTVSTLSFDEKVIIATKGKNTMTGFENILSTEEIKEVVKYTDSL